MKLINKLTVTYHEQTVGELTMTPDNRLCAFQYDKEWLANGFSISPLELPLKPDLLHNPSLFGVISVSSKTAFPMDTAVTY